MRRWIAVLTLSFALAATPALAQDSALEVVRITTTAGETLAGFILERRADGVMLRSDGEDLFVAWSTIERLEPVGESAPRPGSTMQAPSVPLPAHTHSGPAAFRTAHRAHPGFPEYDRNRLVLRDKGRRPIGPDRLGYPPSQFTQRDKYFLATVGPSDPMTIPDFVDLTGDPDLRARLDDRLDAVARRRGAGWVFVATGAALGGTGLTLAAIGGGTGDSTVAYAGGPMLGWSVASAVFGAVLHKIADKESRRLHGTRLERFLDRPEAWDAAQLHNARLRAELSLPDDDRLDADDD